MKNSDPTSALAEAANAFARGDEDVALELIVSAWRAVRAPQLAQLAVSVSARLEPLVPALGGKLEAFHPEWLAMAKQTRAAHFPRLFGSVLTTTNRFGTAVVTALLERGEVLSRWPADPRSASLAVGFLRQGLYEATSRSTLPFWSSVFTMLKAHDDPQAADLLRTLQFAKIFRHFSDGKRRIEWFQRETDAVVAALDARHRARPKLPEDLRASVRKLQKAVASSKGAPNAAVVERLTARPAPPRVPAKKAAPRASPSGNLGEHLDRASGATTDGERLLALLAAWRLRPVPQLAALIDAVSVRLEAKLVPIRGDTRAAIQAEWLRVAKKKDASDLPRLLESLTHTMGRSTDARVRLEALREWPRDPRTPARVAMLLEVPAFHSSSANSFWKALLQLAEDTGDVRGAERFEALAARFEQVLAERYSDRRPLVAWFRRHLMATAGGLRAAEQPTLNAAEVRRCEALSIKMGDLEGRLLKGVADDLANDAPRRVYADFLQERSDPRGEFIALQLQNPSGSARATELASDYAHAWVGPLRPFLDLERCIFERGFLAHAELASFEPERLAGVVAHPVWSTVRTIHLGRAVATTFPVSPTMRSLERVTVANSGQRRVIELARG